MNANTKKRHGRLDLKKFEKAIKFTTLTGNIILRFYEQIITGVWAILLLIPVDRYITWYFRQREAGLFEFDFRKYLIFFTAYSFFFIISAISVPFFKRLLMNIELYKMVKQKYITLRQMIQIKLILEEGLVYRSFFSKEGFYQFMMSNIFNLGVIFAYFGIEDAISNFLTPVKVSYWPSMFYLTMFYLMLSLESVLDTYVAKKMRAEPLKYHENNMSKNVLHVMVKFFSGSTLSEQISERIINDSIEDIYEILDVSRSSVIDIKKQKKDGQGRGMKKRISTKKLTTLQRVNQFNKERKLRRTKKKKTNLFK